jgi:hypothetical protein
MGLEREETAMNSKLTFPFYRVRFRPAIRRGYADNTRSLDFQDEKEAIEKAIEMKNMIREVDIITGVTYAGYGYEKFLSKNIAKWGIGRNTKNQRCIKRLK